MISPSKSTDDWSDPKPDIMTRPTSFPVGMAFGITLTTWGIITSVVLVVVGVIVLVVSLAGWIGEMRSE